MIGVLLMSHGKMAEGMLDSCKLFFGEVEQVKALCLMPSDSPEDFDDRIREAIEEVDDGSGVVAFCDLFGGTPSNRSMYIIMENPRFKVVPGVNLTMLLEVLGRRMALKGIEDLDIDEILEVGRDGIVSLNQKIDEMLGQ